MSITTYSELQTAIADFLDRDDLASVVPTFIALAEADMQRRLRHWEMEELATISITDRFLSVPADWVETIRVQLTGGGTSPVSLISRAEMMEYRANSEDTAGKPEFYTMSAGQFEFFPTPDDTYAASLLYTKKLPALTAGSPTSWLLTTAPDAYLYGALAHSAPYLQDDARASTWASFYQSAIDALNVSSEAAKYSGSGLRVKIRSY